MSRLTPGAMMRAASALLVAGLLCIGVGRAQIGPIPGVGPIPFGVSGFKVLNSGSFVAGSSQNMSRTWTSGYSRQKMTLAFWLKLSTINTSYGMYAVPNDGTQAYDQETTATDQFELADGLGSFTVISTTTFADTNWHQLTAGIDTTQATAANRMHLYLDCTEVTYTTTSYPAQNANLALGESAQSNKIGSKSNSTSFLNGLMAEFYYVDNQQLTPSSFCSGTGGSAKAIKYGAAFGARDIYLNFQTGANPGTDASGNGLNYTNSGVTQSSTVPPF